MFYQHGELSEDNRVGSARKSDLRILGLLSVRQVLGAFHSIGRLSGGFLNICRARWTHDVSRMGELMDEGQDW
jgi:hypothetical protein